MTGLIDEHPDATRLDALAIGRDDQQAAEHVRTCEKCALYIQSLELAQSQFREREAPHAQAFVEAVRLRSRRQRAESRRAWLVRGGGVLALAAGVMLAVRLGQAPGSAGKDGESVGPGQPVVEGPVRFKGGSQAAVIVSRAGKQFRGTDPVALEPGDSIRLEIALDHTTALEAGVLSEAGDWAPLQAMKTFDPGTHFSDSSVEFDESIPAGWIVMGEPQAVAEARRTRRFDNVRTIRVRPKSP